MNCSACGAVLTKRPRARLIMTGVLFLATALALLLFIHIGVVAVGAVLMGIVGVSSLQAARKAGVPRCPRCKT